jgi:hypothetical protein
MALRRGESFSAPHASAGHACVIGMVEALGSALPRDPAIWDAKSAPGSFSFWDNSGRPYV